MPFKDRLNFPVDATGRMIRDDDQNIKKWTYHAVGNNTCEACMQYDGKIFDSLKDAPSLPIHPNCKCRLELIYENDKNSSKNKIREGDDFGSGKYGASRGNRKHQGVDIVKKPGEEVRAVSDGIYTRQNSPYGDGVYKGLDIETEGGEKDRYMYVEPSIEPGTEVKEGDVIGHAQDIAGKYNTDEKEMTNHIHYETRDSEGNPQNPTRKVENGNKI